MLGILNANDSHSIRKIMQIYKVDIFNDTIYLSQGDFALVVLREIMKNYIVYIGQSLLRGEEGCITIGLSSNGLRREYNKVMVVQHGLPCKNLRHARAVEKEGHLFLDNQLERAMVRWNPIILDKAPNRGWDWWITQHTTTHYNNLELIEIMRNRQINWSPSFKVKR